MRNRMVIAAVVALVAGGLLAAVPASAGSDGKVREFVVQYRDGVAAAEARPIQLYSSPLAAGVTT